MRQIAKWNYVKSRNEISHLSFDFDSFSAKWVGKSQPNEYRFCWILSQMGMQISAIWASILPIFPPN